MTFASLRENVLALASIPAPTFAEGRRLDWLEAQLSMRPGSYERDRVGNLVWRLGSGRLRVLVLAHVDTVFSEDVPHVFRQEGARIIGPGIGDNAAAVAVCVQVAGELATEDGHASLAVAFTVGEEGLGNLHGAREACERLRPEVVVAVEGHGLGHVLVDAIGSIRARIRVSGTGGHSWADRGRPSAVHALVEICTTLIGLGTPETPVNIGTISGGQSVNTIAADSECVVEMRALDEASLTEFSEVLDSLVAPAGLTRTIEFVGNRPAGRLDREHPLLAAVRAARAEIGLPDVLGAGSTDANAALAYGIPALTLGVAHGGNMHTLEEWIDSQSLAIGAEQVLRVLRFLVAA